MNPLLILGHTKPVPRVRGRLVSRNATTFEDEPDPLTYAQIESEIESILKRGDPKTPGDLANEIGVAVSRIPYRLKAMAARDRRVHYRNEGNLSIAWWKENK